MIRVRNIDIVVDKADAASRANASFAVEVDDVLNSSGMVNEHTVRAACAKALQQAVSDRFVSVALPPFGCGAGRFPVIGCAKIMSQEILRAARDAADDTWLKEIVICLPADDVFKIFEKQVYGYLRHVIQDLSWGPYVCADIIIEIGKGIILIERTNPPYGWALPGGFVDRGESLEAAAVREAKEETNMDLKDLKQFHTYSDPARDPRFHTITTIFTAKGVGDPQAGDDAKGLKVIPLSQLRQLNFAFDHNKVIDDYLISRGL